MGDRNVCELFSRSWVLFIFSCFLHWLLVAAHITLVIFQQHPPKPIDLTNSSLNLNALSFTISSLPTNIFQAYRVVLVLLTQQLAFNHDYHRGVTIATFSDKSRAWLGIGSALRSLWKQRRARTEPIALLLILVYLGCILGLGITTPAIIRLAPIDTGDDAYIRTTYYLSEVGVNDVVEGFPLVSLLTMISEGGTVDTYGFDGSTIFDIPSSVGTVGRGSAPASAVQFDVKCGYIEGLQQSDPGQYRIQNGTIQYAFHVDDNLTDIYVSLANRSINIVTAQPIHPGDIPPLTMFVASSVPITMDQDQVGSTVQYTPGIIGADIGVIDTGDDESGTEASVSSGTTFTIQILACDMHVKNGTLSIDTDDDLPLAPEPDDNSNQLAKWDLSNAQNASILAGLAVFPTLSPISDNGQAVQLVDDADLSAQFRPTMLEDNIMESLGFYDPSQSSILSVEDLETALEVSLALVYWRAQYRIFDRESVKRFENGTFDDDGFTFGLQAQINPYAAWTGLGLTIVLSIVAFVLSGPVNNTRLVAKPNFFEMVLMLSGGQIVDQKSEEPLDTQSIDSLDAQDLDIARKKVRTHAAKTKTRLAKRGLHIDKIMQLSEFDIGDIV